MKKKTKKLLITLQCATLFMMLILFGFSLYEQNLSQKFLNDPTPDYDAHNSDRIGQEYTSNMHIKIVGMLNASDSANKHLAKAMNSGASASVTFVGLATLTGLLSLFNLCKTPSQE